MFLGKMRDNLIAKTHDRTLRAIYDTKPRSYENPLDLSAKKKSIYKISKFWWLKYILLSNISPPFTLDYLKQKMNPYNLQNIHLHELTKCRTKTYGFNMTLFKEALLCNKLTNHFKEAKSLIHFKNKIRERTGRPCTCCICSQIVSFLKNVHMQKKISVVIQIYF